MAEGPAAEAVYSVPTRGGVLLAVARRLLPRLIEATVVPTTLFYLSFMIFGVVAAYAVALAWSYLSVGRRMVAHRPVPTILLLASIGLTVRTIFALLSGSTFVYFLQPVFGKVLLSAVFVGSIAIGRPLIASFAQDFCAMPPEIASRPGVVRLYRQLTYLWAGLNLAMAVLTLIFLLTLPMGTFVAIRSFMGWAITSAGVALTVSASVQAARREGLLATVSPDGTLCARTQGGQSGGAAVGNPAETPAAPSVPHPSGP
jgi:uncharacterized membrane protein